MDKDLQNELEVQRSVGRLEGKVARMEAELNALRRVVDNLLLGQGDAGRGISPSVPGAGDDLQRR